MLKTILNSFPPTKFILIEDTLQESGTDLLQYVLRSHTNQGLEVHHCILCGNFKSQKSQLPIKIKAYDFTSDIQGWSSANNAPNVQEIVENIKHKSVVVIDSLSHLIVQYGINKSYKLIKFLMNKQNVIQIATVLHTDLVIDSNILPLFEHLSTLCIRREPQFNSAQKRVFFNYKKTSGKEVRQQENYQIKDEVLLTFPVEKIDPEKIIQQNINQSLPDNLTTFRLSLDEKEKESREKLVLPYLPKEISNEKEGGKITYKFDEIDDWDEEDPDDDLNI